MGGFTFGYPVGKDVFLDLRAFTGFIYAVSPEMSVKYAYSSTNTNGTIEIDKNESGAWSTLFSAKLNYQASKYIMLTGGVDFLNSKPTFENVKVITNETNITQTSFSRQIYALIISAGLKYVFY
jgi:outer membrane receptor for ferrienterochelin and colicin